MASQNIIELNGTIRRLEFFPELEFFEFWDYQYLRKRLTQFITLSLEVKIITSHYRIINVKLINE